MLKSGRCEPGLRTRVLVGDIPALRTTVAHGVENSELDQGPPDDWTSFQSRCVLEPCSATRSSGRAGMVSVLLHIPEIVACETDCRGARQTHAARSGGAGIRGEAEMTGKDQSMLKEKRPLRLRSDGHCKFAYSALAAFRMGMSGSAFFQKVRKFL